MILPTLPKGSNPCMNCDHRKIGCHSKCKDYKEFKEKVAELRKRQWQQTISGSARSAEIHSNYSIRSHLKKEAQKVIYRVNKKG